MFKPLYAALAAALLLSGCSDAQVDTVQAGAAKVGPALQTACNAAMALAPVAAAVPQAAAIVPFVMAGCGAAEGLAKLAADPSSVAWVNGLVAKMQAVIPPKA
jgi:hypothetical protein